MKIHHLLSQIADSNEQATLSSEGIGDDATWNHDQGIDEAEIEEEEELNDSPVSSVQCSVAEKGPSHSLPLTPRVSNEEFIVQILFMNLDNIFHELPLQKVELF